MDTISIGETSDRDLSINSDSSDGYGPSTGEESDERIQESKKIVNALTVYSTLYSSLALVPLLKESESRKIPFSIITANGFASIVAVLYAKKKSSNYLEWKLFDLLKRLKDITPFSKRWESVIEKFLKAEFGAMQLQQLKVLVLIPENSKGEVKLSSTGSVVSKVMQTISLQNKRSYYQSPKDFTRKLDVIGMDLNLSVAFTSEKSNFKYLSGFKWGLYTTYLSFLDQNSHLYQAISTPKEQILDAVSPLSDISSTYRVSIEKILNDYQLKIEDWKNQNSTSSETEI